MSTLKNIVEGWSNKLRTSAYIDSVVNERMEVCIKCRFCSINVDTLQTKLRPDVHCTDCGCTLSAKTACLSCECPKGHWLPKPPEKDERRK